MDWKFALIVGLAGSTLLAGWLLWKVVSHPSGTAQVT